jgi:hypothetical protein
MFQPLSEVIIRYYKDATDKKLILVDICMTYENGRNMSCFVLLIRYLSFLDST